jgi:hypothetical protein
VLSDPATHATATKAATVFFMSWTPSGFLALTCGAFTEAVYTSRQKPATDWVDSVHRRTIPMHLTATERVLCRDLEFWLQAERELSEDENE